MTWILPKSTIRKQCDVKEKDIIKQEQDKSSKCHTNLNDVLTSEQHYNAIRIFKNQDIMNKLWFFIIDDDLRNKHINYNIDNVKYFSMMEQEMVKGIYGEKRVDMEKGYTIGISNKCSDLTLLKFLIIKEINNFINIKDIDINHINEFNIDIINVKLHNVGIKVNIIYKEIIEN